MPNGQRRGRRIVLFVEGKTEHKGKAVANLIHRWLDPQLPANGRVGITPVNLKGSGNYLSGVGKRVEWHLSQSLANFAFGLVDLYGFPGISGGGSVEIKIKQARAKIKNTIPGEYRNRFHQHFAVHETEAWLLADPVTSNATNNTRPPEKVNFHSPPSKFLKKHLPGGYKKTTHGVNKFSVLDPTVVYQKCPFFKQFMDDLLTVAIRLQ